MAHVLPFARPGKTGLSILAMQDGQTRVHKSLWINVGP